MNDPLLQKYVQGLSYLALRMTVEKVLNASIIVLAKYWKSQEKHCVSATTIPDVQVSPRSYPVHVELPSSITCKRFKQEGKLSSFIVTLSDCCRKFTLEMNRLLLTNSI